MNVLQLTKHYPPYFGGIETVTYDLTEGINASGSRCDVLCANNSRKGFVEQKAGYQIYRAGSFGKFFSTSMAPGLIGHLWSSRKKYDIIHVHFPDPMNALAIFICRPKCKLVVHWHSDIIKQEKLLRYYRLLQNWILKKADLIIGTTPKYINESFELQPFLHKTIAIPIGINESAYKLDVNILNQLKDKYRNRKVIFALGRLVYYKGFEYLIKSAALLPDNYIILIGGVGKEHDFLKEIIHAEKLNHKVELVGKIPQLHLPAYYTMCDLFCLPSIERSEAFGVVQVEAMMFGKPVVATDIPMSGVSWVNQDHLTGFNVRIKDPAALAEKIQFILSDKQLYQEYSINAVNRYNELFKADTMVKSVIANYIKLMG